MNILEITVIVCICIEIVLFFMWWDLRPMATKNKGTFHHFIKELDAPDFLVREQAE